MGGFNSDSFDVFRGNGVMCPSDQELVLFMLELILPSLIEVGKLLLAK